MRAAFTVTGTGKHVSTNLHRTGGYATARVASFRAGEDSALFASALQ